MVAFLVLVVEDGVGLAEGLRKEEGTERRLSSKVELLHKLLAGHSQIRIRVVWYRASSSPGIKILQGLL